MTKKIRILLVDDHAIVRYGIRSLIERNLGFEVCGEAGTLAEAYEKVRALKPNIVLLDIKLPDGDGANGCREIKKISPESKVIILTAFAEDSILIEAIRSGIDGYLLKNIDSKTIISSLSDVAKGLSILDPAVLGKVMSAVKRKEDTLEQLTSQECTILDLISLGKTNKEIGQELFVAEKTIRNYVSKIMRKVNVNNRTEAAMYWSRQKSLK